MESASLRLIDFGDDRVVYTNNYTHDYMWPRKSCPPSPTSGTNTSSIPSSIHSFLPNCKVVSHSSRVVKTQLKYHLQCLYLMINDVHCAYEEMTMCDLTFNRFRHLSSCKPN